MLSDLILNRSQTDLVPFILSEFIISSQDKCCLICFKSLVSLLVGNDAAAPADQNGIGGDHRAALLRGQ